MAGISRAKGPLFAGRIRRGRCGGTRPLRRLEHADRGGRDAVDGRDDRHGARPSGRRALRARRLRTRRRRRQRGQRLRPEPDPARLRRRQGLDAGGRAHAARVGPLRRRQGDRDRPRRHVRGLDVQRPHPRPDAALHRGRPPADQLHERQRAPAHRPLPRHPPRGDGRRAGPRGIGGGLIQPGQSFTYEFDAVPFGLHLYHCHASPLAAHIAKGLYGAFIIDPKEPRPRPTRS